MKVGSPALGDDTGQRSLAGLPLPQLYIHMYKIKSGIYIIKYELYMYICKLFLIYVYVSMYTRT